MNEKDYKRTVDDNLTSLVELDEHSLLESVKRRYLSGKIYTDVGDILLAVNPFQKLPIFSKEWSQLYSRATIDDLSPHIFGVAAKAFNALLQTKKDQVCVISGESGAGKTESTKLIIHQLMKLCKSSKIGDQLQNKIIQLNPVLEAFGNAKTLLNDNSSRFGKFIQLMFTSNGRIVGGGLDQYLLEKSRVCVHQNGECNYHIFYYLFDGLHPDIAKQFKLTSLESHHYMRPCETTSSASESRQKFVEVTESMKAIGFVDEEINQIVAILAAILHIGDIDFAEADSTGDSSRVVNMEKIDIASRLLKLEYPEDLCFALTTLRTTTRGEVVDKLYSPSKAADVRDALAKGLYSRMFQWLISRINNYIAPHDNGNYIGIGILDIFGFEIFKMNSFEQFCINIANEQLQQYFNAQIFAMEKEEYIKEGVAGVDISYQDNQAVLELFLARPVGLISLLDEQCRTNGNESRLMERYRQNFMKHSNFVPHKGNALLFTVHHYAGKVEYTANGFIDKNRDSLPETVQGVLKFSGVRLARTLFTNYPNFNGSVLRSTTRVRPSQRSVLKKMSVRKKKSSRHRERGGKRKLMTVSGHFRESLQKLMERIFSATPHFVRCFKPNSMKLPSVLDEAFVLKQLKYTGMLEAVRVRREGFAYRPFFSDFVNDYKRLAYRLTDKTVHSSRETCQKILNVAGITGWKIGKSRVFLRYYHEEKLNRMLLEIENKAVRIQSAYKGYRVRKIYKPILESARQEKAKVGDILMNISQHSEDIFQRIVELNKIDVLEAIQRFGHPNEGWGNEPPVVEPDETQERKFKPKAVGGVAILMDAGPIPVVLRQRKHNHDSDLTDLPKNTPPAIQPRKKSKETCSFSKDVEDTSNSASHSAQKQEENTNSISSFKDLLSNDKSSVSRKPSESKMTESGSRLSAPKQDQSSNAKKKNPPPVSPKPKRRIVSNTGSKPVPKEEIKRHSDEANELFLTSKKSSDHLSVMEEKRSHSVSPIPARRHFTPRRKGNLMDPSNHSSTKNNKKSISSDEFDYIDMELDMSTLDSPLKKRKPAVHKPPLVGAVKLFPESKDSYIQSRYSAKSQISPESPVEFNLSHVSKKDSTADSPATAPIAGPLAQPRPVQTYTIHTSPKQFVDQEEVEYTEITARKGSESDQQDTDEEYVLPYVYSKDSNKDKDNVIYANIELSKSVDNLVDYANVSTNRSSSMDNKMRRQVTPKAVSQDVRSKSLSANNQAKISVTSISNSHTTNLLSGLSTSVPDLLSATSSSVSPSGSVERLLLNGDNGLSLNSPLLHRVSVFSTGSSDSRNSTPSFEGLKKKKFGDLFKRKKNRERSSNVSSYNGENPDPIIGSAQLAGYFPGISSHDANKMLIGQSSGTYLLLTDYSRNGNFIFKLAVSQGKGKRIWSSDIETHHSRTGERGLILISDGRVFQNLKSLCTYYKSHPIDKAGLRLANPVQVKSLEKVKKKKVVPLPVLQ